MRIEDDGNYLRPFSPLQENISIPYRKDSYTDHQEKDWYILRDRWAMGQDRFIQMYRDEEKGKGLREFPWTHPSEDLTLRQIFEEVIGFKDRTGRQHGGYKKLREVRTLLNLGSYPRRIRGETHEETVYVFTPREVAQLIIGFLAYTAK